MAVGKGRTARALAAATGRFAVDTDDLIESMVKMKIRKIFARHGEDHFRALEQRAADWLERQVSATIVSTGGGFFMVNNLHRLGRVIYLHSSLEGILAAIRSHPNGEKKIAKRPLLQDIDRARLLYDQRLPLYRAACDTEINVEGREIAEVATEIAALIA
ncbi:MAG TPA: shikimate kinase [Desulfobulbus sp.]|nr:shikimate kinase [Desulfobulbus sp.]